MTRVWELTELAAAVIEQTVPLLERAAGGHVDALVGEGGGDAFVAVRHALEDDGYHEVIVSTLPERVSHWPRRDLPSKVQALGLPVTVVVAESRRARASMA